MIVINLVNLKGRNFFQCKNSYCLISNRGRLGPRDRKSLELAPQHLLKFFTPQGRRLFAMAINLLGLRLSRHRTISPCQTPIDLLILIDDSFGGAIIWWRDDRETTNLIYRAVGNSQMAFFYFFKYNEGRSRGVFHCVCSSLYQIHSKFISQV